MVGNQASERALLDFGLRRKRALVAGAGRGIGRASALGLAEAGARVACVDVDAGRAHAVADEICAAGGDAFAVVADLRLRDDAERAIATTADGFGGLDVLVDVIGEARWGRLVEQSDENWEASFEAVLRHAVFLGRAAARRMIDQKTGRAIVSIASVSGLFAAPLHGPYGAAKAALIAFTLTLAVELAPAGIRVNTVAPGAVLTPRAIEMTTPERREVTARAVPLGRWAEPDDVARAVVFLASELASYVTGHTLVVDGGASVKFPLTVGG